MKKYYCPNCKKFKSRLQLIRKNDTRVAYFTCGRCHNFNVYTTEDVLYKLMNKTSLDQELSSKHGSFL